MWNNNQNQNPYDRNQQTRNTSNFKDVNQQSRGLGAFARNQSQAYPGYESTMADRSSLASKVMTFTFFSLLAAMAGTFLGMQLNLRFGGLSWILFMVVEIALIFVAMAVRDRTPLNFIALYAFAAVTGVSISPTVDILTDIGLGGIVLQALGLTAGITLALTVYAWTTKRDFSGLAPYLFAGVIGLILVGLLNALIFRSPLLQMVYLYAGVIIFSFYIIFDVQNVKKYPNTIGNAIMLSLNMYLNIFNLFIFILQLLLSSRD